MGKPVIWTEMTVEEIREYLEKRPTVILPLGCTEQHGYHLPVSVDILNAVEMAKRVKRIAIIAGIVLIVSQQYNQKKTSLHTVIPVTEIALSKY